MSGFRNSADEWQEKCPCCGRFVARDDAFYMWVAAEPDFVSAFCDEACARRYQMTGGEFIDGDGQPYIPNWNNG